MNQEEILAPTPQIDTSGRSSSSEGDIANHNPFNVASDIIKPEKTEIKKQLDEEMPNAVEIKQVVNEPEQLKPQKAAPKKTIIYSDKSESSIDDMMGDTPSNYNIPNGRLDGKSLGLKAMVTQTRQQMQAQNKTNDAV
eukprot:CAMPEP_0116886668 /NCGR_PEP_ID=MMETSP0463-20121206/20609_1 /TAXON_ID=181622 /ORGANISM="Strombidinopsis sp, Strain SopsisLIS2011" /LENGTH=137 /DNA_ID=CAMNT_0004547501 /DNA_START=611 /DNA_END=1024 /DNA_ORIENTATION=+